MDGGVWVLLPDICEHTKSEPGSFYTMPRCGPSVRSSGYDFTGVPRVSRALDVYLTQIVGFCDSSRSCLLNMKIVSDMNTDKKWRVVQSKVRCLASCVLVDFSLMRSDRFV